MSKFFAYYQAAAQRLAAEQNRIMTPAMTYALMRSDADDQGEDFSELTQSEVGRRLYIQPRTVGKAFEVLKKRGLIEQVPSLSTVRRWKLN